MEMFCYIHLEPLCFERIELKKENKMLIQQENASAVSLMITLQTLYPLETFE